MTKVDKQQPSPDPAKSNASKAVKVEQQKSDAVVIRAEDAQRAPMQLVEPAADISASDTIAMPRSQGQKPGTATALPAGKPRKVLPRGTGLTILDIDRQGRSVLITNPANRMPKRFVIGDVLPNGERLLAIDPASDLIVAGEKHYVME